MPPIRFPPFFEAFLQSLNSGGVEYLLVGGWAVQFYGYPRSTRDLDIWISTRRENAEKISRIMRFWTRENPNFPSELFEHPNRIIRLILPPVSIEIVDPIVGQAAKVLQQFQVENPEQMEILTVQTGAEFYDCYANRVVEQIDGLTINIISLQDLKKIKQAGNRPKDREDLVHLG